MASQKALCDLPNELLQNILKYLTPIDIIKAFYDFKSHRMQKFIKPFFAKFDISEESHEWTQNHLSMILSMHEISFIRLKMNQLVSHLKHLLATKIQSMELINWEDSSEFAEQIIDHLRKNLKELSFISPGAEEYPNLTGLLFQSDSRLERVNIKDYPMYFSVDEIGVCTQLKHVCIVLEGMNYVFMLISQLPNLEILEVDMFSQECIAQAAPSTQGIKTATKLRSVTFKNWIKYFDHMETFFATFGSTIEHLYLNIDCRYYLYDGKYLERVLVDKMPRLISLDLIIFSPMADNHHIEIETFHGQTWNKFNPIVYWYDVRAQQHTLFTLPYKSECFQYFSNDFVQHCVSNRPVSIRFEHVRTLILTNTTPLNRETFLYIEKIFPRIKIVEIKKWIVNDLEEDDVGDDDSEDEPVENKAQDESIFSDDLMLDTTGLEILSVRALSLYLPAKYIDYRTFRCFLQLFPNLDSLKLSLEQSLLYDILKHEKEDKSIKVALARIKELTVNPLESETTSIDADIKYLFPNVKKPVFEYIY